MRNEETSKKRNEQKAKQEKRYTCKKYILANYLDFAQRESV